MLEVVTIKQAPATDPAIGELPSAAEEIAAAFKIAHAAIKECFKLKPENGGAGANERENTMELLGTIVDYKMVLEGLKHGIKIGALRQPRAFEPQQETQD